VFFATRKLNDLYLSVAIKSFALSMLGIFIPIFLIKQEYNLPSVLIFYAVINATHALFVVPATKICSAYGFRYCISLSFPLLLIFYTGLYTLNIYHWPLFFLGFVFGLSNAFYWTGYHLDFSVFGDHHHRGREVGTVKIITLIFQALGPFVGGLILAFIGFGALFISAAILLLCSSLPLFFLKKNHSPIIFSAKKFFKGQKIKDVLTFAGYGIESGIATVIWPVFIFFAVLNNFWELGLISSLSLFFSLIFIFVVGKLFDIYGKIILKLGSILNTAVWIFRFFVRTKFQVYLADSFYGITQTLVHVPFDAMSYEKANKTDIINLITLREITIQTARVVLFILLIFISDFTFSFLFGGGASLLFLLF